jgi:hypothetical protein
LTTKKLLQRTELSWLNSILMVKKRNAE